MLRWEYDSMYLALVVYHIAISLLSYWPWSAGTSKPFFYPFMSCKQSEIIIRVTLYGRWGFIHSLSQWIAGGKTAVKEAYILEIIYYIAYIPEITIYTTMVDTVYKNTWTEKTVIRV